MFSEGVYFTSPCLEVVHVHEVVCSVKTYTHQVEGVSCAAPSGLDLLSNQEILIICTHHSTFQEPMIPPFTIYARSNF